MIYAGAASRSGLAPSERNAKPGSILCGDGKQDATSTRLPPRAPAPAAVTIHHTSSSDGATARSEGAAPGPEENQRRRCFARGTWVLHQMPSPV